MQVVTLPNLDNERKIARWLEPLVPKGLGTSQLECLTSYLCRLANHHWLTPHTLRQYAETHHFNETYDDKRFYVLREPATINGQGQRAHWLASALNSGTGRTDLLNLTLYHLEPALDRIGKGLLHQALHWCPECWRQDDNEDGEPYVRLFWTSAITSCCPTHDRLLSDKCPHCQAKQSAIPTLPALWACQTCGQNLFPKGRSRAFGARLKPNKEQVWLAKSIEKLIERTCVNGEPLPQGCTERAIDLLALRYAFGSSSELAVKLNIDARYLKNWRYGRSRPTLLSLADLSYRLDIPLDQLLLDSDLLTAPALWRDIKPPHFINTTRLSAVRKNEIRKALSRMISKPPEIPPSVKQISDKFKLSYTTLNSHFPEEYDILQKRACIWRQKRAAKNQDERIRKLNAGVRELIEMNIYPSERQLRDHGYLIPSDLRRPAVLTELKKLQARYIHLIQVN